MRYNTVKTYLQLVCLLALTLSISTVLAGQQAEVGTLAPLEMGTTLPVVLHEALYSGKTAVGTRVLATTTQRVPIGAHRYLRRGAELIGTVTESVGGEGSGQAGTLSLRFTALRYRGQTVPVAVDAIAIANFTDVDDTWLPADGGTDRGNASPASWTTRQVGGDEVFRSGWEGPVCDGHLKKVGFADVHGVYSLPVASAGETAGFAHALGVFSASASGLYGFDEGVALRSSQGAIRITGPWKKAFIRRGDNLLLRVTDGR